MLRILTALGRPDDGINVKGALATGVSVDEIKEILIHATVICAPAGRQAFRAAHEVGPRACYTRTARRLKPRSTPSRDFCKRRMAAILPVEGTPIRTLGFVRLARRGACHNSGSPLDDQPPTRVGGRAFVPFVTTRSSSWPRRMTLGRLTPRDAVRAKVGSSRGVEEGQHSGEDDLAGADGTRGGGRARRARTRARRGFRGAGQPHPPAGTGGPVDAFLTAAGAVPVTAVGTLLAVRRPRI